MPEIPVTPACRGRCKTEGVDREAQRRLCHPERFAAAAPAGDVARRAAEKYAELMEVRRLLQALEHKLKG